MNITSSQQETIERIKTVFRYKHGLKEFNIEDHTDFLSVTGTGDFFMNHFQAIIGRHGGLSTYREGEAVWKGKKADTHIYYILKEMAEKGQYKFPVRKPKPEPSIYGIQFYSTGERKPHQGLYSIGIHRNPTTEKYFKWAFPTENQCGVLFEYSYMSNGGDGLIKIDLPTGEREWVSFGYEPWKYLYIRSGVNHEEQLNSRLSNRQIIAKVFNAWLKSRGLL